MWSPRLKVGAPIAMAFEIVSVTDMSPRGVPARDTLRLPTFERPAERPPLVQLELLGLGGAEHLGCASGHPAALAKAKVRGQSKFPPTLREH